MSPRTSQSRRISGGIQVLIIILVVIVVAAAAIVGGTAGPRTLDVPVLLCGRLIGFLGFLLIIVVIVVVAELLGGAQQRVDDAGLRVESDSNDQRTCAALHDVRACGVGVSALLERVAESIHKRNKEMGALRRGTYRIAARDRCRPLCARDRSRR